ncbi:hypothetical protein ACFY4H_25385 [Streptomyces althioticus]
MDDQIGADAAEVVEDGGQHAYGGAGERLQQRERGERFGQRRAPPG